MNESLPQVLTAKDRPDKTGVALLQALHVLNEWEDQQIRKMEYGQEKDQPPVHPYAWGLFKTTLLKAVKNREDLKKWSADTFEGQEKCPHCNGEGKTVIPQDSQRYRDMVADELEWSKEPDYKPFFVDGDELFSHCTPCQGSGILTKLDKKLGK